MTAAKDPIMKKVKLKVLDSTKNERDRRNTKIQHNIIFGFPSIITEIED